MAPAPEGRGPLDFLSGYWVMRDAESGRPDGHSSLLRVEGGRVFVEQWSWYSGASGRGMFYLDPADGNWCLVRVDNQGQVQRLRGGVEDGALRMTGELVHHGGRTSPLRMVLERRSDGELRQTCQVTEDDGASWLTVSESLLNRDDPMWAGRRFR